MEEKSRMICKQRRDISGGKRKKSKSKIVLRDRRSGSPKRKQEGEEAKKTLFP